jgi:hypothetical protein
MLMVVVGLFQAYAYLDAKRGTRLLIGATKCRPWLLCNRNGHIVYLSIGRPAWCLKCSNGVMCDVLPCGIQTSATNYVRHREASG